MNYIFTHINRCGGTSVRKALTGKIKHDHRCIYCKRREMDAHTFNKAFKFSIVRNPFERLVSMYHYRKVNNRHNIINNDIGFEEWFYKSVVRNELPHFNNPLMFSPCFDWVSEDYRIIVDYIVRLKELESHWPYIQQKTAAGLLPHLNETQHDDPYTFFDAEMRHIVHRKYKKDFTYWFN